MKKITIVLLLIGFAGNVQSKKERQQHPIPVYAMKQIDSLIAHQPGAAIFFWPTWCVPSTEKMKAVIELFSTKTQIQLYLVAEAHSKNEKIADFERKFGTEKIIFIKQKKEHKDFPICINDYRSIIAFNRHFVRDKNVRNDDEKLLRFPTCYVFDSKGALVYSNSEALNIDSLSAAISKL